MGRRAHVSPHRGGELLHDILLHDWSKFDPLTGLRASVFVIAPLVIGAATGQLLEGLFATIGANFITNTEGSGPGATRLRVLAAACVIEPAAIAVGTLTAATGSLAVPLVGAAVFLLLMVRSRQGWALVGLVSAIAFVLGAGIPGASESSAAIRFVSSLAGDLWILLGVALQRELRPDPSAAVEADSRSVVPMGSRHVHPFLSGISVRSETFRQAVITGIACSLGLAIGVALDLPRDVWILITIIVAVRPGIGPTASSTVILVTGTVVGAAVAGVITLETTSLDALTVLLFAFAFGMYSSRLVNQAMFQSLLTPFLVILLNVVYPGGWRFALVRILDVAIGGAVAILLVYLLVRRAHGSGPA